MFVSPFDLAQASSIQVSGCFAEHMIVANSKGHASIPLPTPRHLGPKVICAHIAQIWPHFSTLADIAGITFHSSHPYSWQWLWPRKAARPSLPAHVSTRAVAPPAFMSSTSPWQQLLGHLPLLGQYILSPV